MTWQTLLAPIGIAFLVLLSMALGASKLAKLASPDEAKERFAQDFPGCHVRSVILSSDSESALLELGEDSIGLVFAVGKNFATRLWKQGADWGFQRDPVRILFAPYDDSTKPIVFVFDSEREADLWETRLTPILGRTEYRSDKPFLENA